MSTTWRELALVTIPAKGGNIGRDRDAHILLSSGRATSEHKDDLLSIVMPYHRTLMDYGPVLELYRAIGEWLDEQEARGRGGPDYRTEREAARDDETTRAAIEQARAAESSDDVATVLNFTKKGTH